MTDITAVVAIDTETNGLDITSALLEIALVPGTPSGDKLPGVDPFVATIARERVFPRVPLPDVLQNPDLRREVFLHHHGSVEHAYLDTNDYVREMHTKNGLWEECSQPAGTGNRVSLAELPHAVLGWLEGFAPEPGSVQLLGATPHLDVDMLKANAEAAWLHVDYHVFDVSTVKALMRRTGLSDVPEHGDENHRALGDARAAMDVYHHIVSVFEHLAPTAPWNA